jgi:two-component system, LuxR family, sensor kinase FixL
MHSAHVAAAIVEAAPDGIITVDRQGKIASANRALEQLFGYSRAELFGQPIEILVPEVLRARHVTSRDAYLEQPRTREMGAGAELLGRRKDGTVFPVEIMLSAIEGDDRARAVAVVRDVTRRRRAEEERHRLIREAQASLVAREELVAIASHDLRSPLSGVKLQLQALERRVGKLDDAVSAAWLTERIRLIDDTIDHTCGLLDSLLERHRREAAALEFQREDLDLAALAKRVAVRLEPQFAHVGSTLHVTAATDVNGRWDGLRIEQAITNLLGNALRFAGALPVELHVTSNADSAEIIVRDRGPGIAPEALGQLFQRGATGGGGFGLGLWIVKQIVEAHGGDVRVESMLGAGTTFRVVLPK